MDATDWRDQLSPGSREKIVNKILERHHSVRGRDELGKMAEKFEEKVFTAATSQSDYLRKISLKMLSMETKSQGIMANNIPPNQAGPSNKSSDPGLVMPQVHNPGQQHPIPLPNQPQSRQQLLSQNSQNNIASQPNLPHVSCLSQTPIQNVGQNPNMQNMFAGSQREMQGMQQVVPQQQQQQLQNPHQYLYEQQLLRQQQLQHQLQLPHQLQLRQQQQQQQPLQQQQQQQLQLWQHWQHWQQQLQSQQRLRLRQQQHLQLLQQQQLQQQQQILALGTKQSSRGIRRPTWTHDYMN